MPEIDEITRAVRSGLGEMTSPETAHRLAKALRPTHGREAVEDVERDARSFDLRWKADMRAIKRWQEAHPGKDLVWPDHADLCVWLLDEVDRLRSRAEPSEIPMTEIDTGKLREIASAATPGTWWSAGGYVTTRHPESASFSMSIYHLDELGQETSSAPFQAVPFARASDAAHVAAFQPTTALALLDEIDGLRSRIEQAEAKIAQASKHTPVYRAVERVLDEHSAWISRPNHEVTAAIALSAVIAADLESGASGTLGALHERCDEADAETANLRALLRRAGEALDFYGDISKYPAPLTGGMGALWSDCGITARTVAREIEEALK